MQIKLATKIIFSLMQQNAELSVERRNSALSLPHSLTHIILVASQLTCV